VSKDLSDEISLLLGIYVQTCARIEDMAANLICVVEDIDLEHCRHSSRYIELRKRTISELITEISKSSGKLPKESNLREYLKDECAHLHRFAINRHKAVHGVLRKVDGNLEITSVNKKSSQVETERMTVGEVNFAIEDAERILLGLYHCLKELSQ
jgi:hypothetical protein